MAAPAPAAVGTPAVSTSTTLTPGTPSGSVSGSLLVANITAYWSGSTVPTEASVTPPSGWLVGQDAGSTHLFYAAYATPDNVACFEAWYYFYGTGTFQWSFANVGGGAVAESYGTIFRVTGGASSGNPFVDTYASQHNGGTGSTLTIGPYTPGAANTLCLAGVLADNSGTWSIPAGWTQQSYLAGGSSMVTASVTQTTPASLSPTFSVAGGGWYEGLIVSLRAPSGTPASITAAPAVGASRPNAPIVVSTAAFTAGASNAAASAPAPTLAAGAAVTPAAATSAGSAGKPGLAAGASVTAAWAEAAGAAPGPIVAARSALTAEPASGASTGTAPTLAGASAITAVTARGQGTGSVPSVSAGAAATIIAAAAGGIARAAAVVVTGAANIVGATAKAFGFVWAPTVTVQEPTTIPDYTFGTPHSVQVAYRPLTVQVAYRPLTVQVAYRPLTVETPP